MSSGPRAPPLRGRRAARRPLPDTDAIPPDEADRSVVDTWPATVPVRRAEIAVLETFCAPLLDAFFGVEAESSTGTAKATAKPPLEAKE